MGREYTHFQKLPGRESCLVPSWNFPFHFSIWQSCRAVPYFSAKQAIFKDLIWSEAVQPEKKSSCSSWDWNAKLLAHKSLIQHLTGWNASTFGEAAKEGMKLWHRRFSSKGRLSTGLQQAPLSSTMLQSMLGARAHLASPTSLIPLTQRPDIAKLYLPTSPHQKMDQTHEFRGQKQLC